VKVAQLIKGTHKMQNMEGGVDIVDHTGSVTLIQDGKSNILVDVGARGRFEELQKKLSENNVTTNTVELIILTHFHLDHSFNIGMFPKARIIGWSHEWKSGSTFRISNIETWSVAPGISILPTPGHTPEHISVVVAHEDGKKTVITGDAINQDFADTKKISAYAFDLNLYSQSAEKIMTVGKDLIIGHGEPISLK